jgi:hypothetical protein
VEPEDSLLHSQVPATCPYSEPARYTRSPYRTSHLLKIHRNVILPSMPGSPKWSLSLRFPHQNPVYASPLPIRATFPTNVILVLSPEQYWVSCRDRSAYYVVMRARLTTPDTTYVHSMLWCRITTYE